MSTRSVLAVQTGDTWKGPHDIRAFRVLKAGHRLEPAYDGVVVTSAGPQIIPAGTVLQ